MAPPLPRECSFRAGVASPGSYWLCGTVTRTARVYWSSAARVLRDIRWELGLEPGASYDLAVMERLAARWESVRPAALDPTGWTADLVEMRAQWRDGEMVPREALRSLIWLTYVRATPYGPDGPLSILFGNTVGLPRVGESVGATDASAVTRYESAYNANAQPFNVFTGEAPAPNARWYNPWCVAPACNVADFDVGAQREAANRPAKKPFGLSGGGVLAVGVATLLVMSGDSK